MHNASSAIRGASPAVASIAIGIGRNDILWYRRPRGNLRTLAAEMEDDANQRCVTDKVNIDVLGQK